MTTREGLEEEDEEDEEVEEDADVEEEPEDAEEEDGSPGIFLYCEVRSSPSFDLILDA